MDHIVNSLGTLLHLPLHSIELIPGDGSELLVQHSQNNDKLTPGLHSPFLLVEGNLGVPQKVLYKAYIAAAGLFTQLRRHRRRSHDNRLTVQEVDELRLVSVVLLLANPAHQSALSIRKQLVQENLIDAEHELRTTEALLTLRDGSKQSILWHHRRWLLRRLFLTVIERFPPLADDDSLLYYQIPADALRSELKIASRASETYHRNYFAWLHRFKVLEALSSLARSSPSRDSYRRLLAEEYAAIQQWVERHVSDYTAMQYMRSLYTVALEVFPLNVSSDETTARYQSRLADHPSLLEHAQSLVELYPNHESLWLYLRAGIPATPPRDYATALARKLLDQHAEDGAESEGVRAHAHRYLAWLERQHDKVSDNVVCCVRGDMGLDG